MISRPLDLASRLAPPPRRMEYVFFVNVALVAVMFQVLGSRFVLSPGLPGTFLPEVAGAREGGAPATAYISILASGQIFTADGLKTPDQLREWLQARRAASGSGFATRGVKPVLQILADGSLPAAALARVVSVASAAGFTSTIIAARDPAAAAP